MNYNNSDYEIRQLTRDEELRLSRSFPVLMRKVYVWMALALVITGLTAYGVATSPALITAVATNGGLVLGLVVAELALVWGVSAAINRLSLATATLMFVAYSVLNGVTLSVIFLAYTMSSITSVFFITAGTFAAMAFVGFVTKKDLSSMGRILFMALIGLIIATVVNMFMRSTGLMMILNYVGVLVFVGLTAYDTQRLKQIGESVEELDGNSMKVGVVGALTLYLDFINIFFLLLGISGKRS